MTHPYLRVLLEAFKQWIRRIYRLQMGTAVFTAVGFLNLAAQSMADELSTIADAKDWQTTDKLAEIDLEGLGVVDAVR